MKKGLTELVFILDRSGSMSGLEDDTIGGFNATIKKQKDVEGNALVTTYLFDNNIKMIHDRVNLSTIEPLTKKEYFVGGSTALLDAMGEAITHIEQIHKYINPEDVPENTMFVITTDGYENSSRKYDSQKIKSMVSAKKEKENWQFIFLAANIDAIETAERYGISEDSAVNYNNDSKGTGLVYDAINNAVTEVRQFCCMKASWKKEVNEDYNKRSKKSNKQK